LSAIVTLAGLLPEHFRIVGTAPAQGAPSEAGFKKHADNAMTEFATTRSTAKTRRRFENALSFGAADPHHAPSLVSALQAAEKKVGGQPQRLFHPAVPPVATGSVIEMLGASGLAQGARVIIEKPFGTDLASARGLNESIHTAFDESQVLRIDHFLGKESARSECRPRSTSRPRPVGAAPRLIPYHRRS
jgi:glucose-6-phosphate 1-dehydrogenase